MTKDELIEQTANSELMQFLGVKIVEVSAERVVLAMEVTPKVHQYIGIMNGGVSLYLCETAASVGTVAGVDLTKFTPVGIEINANHLRAVSKRHHHSRSKNRLSGPHIECLADRYNER